MEKLEKLKEALLGPYEVRKTYAQKSEFIDWARGYAQLCGAEMTVEESGKAKLTRSRNIIFGDVKTAKTLVTAHYDTCARLPFPNFMTPACWPIIIVTQILLPVLFFGFLGFMMGHTAGQLADDAGIFAILISLLTMVICFGAVFLMLFGPANPHTANDNTSGVAAVLRLLPEYAGRKDVAFVLFDNEEKGLLGSSAFVKAHPELMKNAYVVNLDCISDGDTLLFAYSKKVKACAQTQALMNALDEAAQRYGKQAMTGQSPKVLYPSDQMMFKKGTAFAALKGKKILYLDRIHTVKDTAFDDRNILCLCEVIQKAI